jgi:hypothetical protein
MRQSFGLILLLATTNFLIARGRANKEWLRTLQT